MGSKNLEGGLKYFGVKFLDFRNIKVKQNTILDTRQYGMMPVTIHKLPSEENPGFVAAWSPSPPPPPYFHRRGGALPINSPPPRLYCTQGILKSLHLPRGVATDF